MMNYKALLPNQGNVVVSLSQTKRDVDDFLKKSSVLSYSFEALEMDGPTVLEIAGKEGLWAHGRAVSLRLEALEEFADEDDSMAQLKEVAGLDVDVLDEISSDQFEEEEGGS